MKLARTVKTYNSGHLSSREIWVKPLALALPVDSRQEAPGELI